MNYNTQGWYDPTIQHLILGNSSELNTENSKGSEFGGLHVTNQGTLNNDKKWVFEEPHVDTFCAV